MVLDATYGASRRRCSVLAVAIAAAEVCGRLLHAEYGPRHGRSWLSDIYKLRQHPWAGRDAFDGAGATAPTLLDIGGANPFECFTDGFFGPGDVIADATNLSTLCFTEADRASLTLLHIDLEDDHWEVLERYVARHGKFAYSVMMHTLEDLHNVRGAARKLSLVAKAGVVVMPSKFAELYDFERRAIANIGTFAAVGPWEKSWRGYYHHRWVFAVKDGKLHAVPKTAIVDQDPVLGSVTSRAARMQLEELRVFWEGSLPLEVPFQHGFAATVQAYRALLSNDEHEEELRRKAEDMLVEETMRDFEVTDDRWGFYSGLASRADAGDGTPLCLAWDVGVGARASLGSLAAKPCAAQSHRWRLDERGLFQDMSRPGWCLGRVGAGSDGERGEVAAVHCPEADVWILPAWVTEPWFLIKSRDIPDLCLGLEPNGGGVIGRSCVPGRRPDTYDMLLWRLEGRGTQWIIQPTDLPPAR
eukprot:TRINITY_DN28647_c0_g1_i2.p1 TRINITY_DN28647_c0_g1~~TRINITY_DN28647_c0_g1_i2.p1  ORF type:complete len:495 (-),score=98.58 TRINITY_DN28647_c0_g1_i2:41-1456(-)